MSKIIIQLGTRMLLLLLKLSFAIAKRTGCDNRSRYFLYKMILSEQLCQSYNTHCLLHTNLQVGRKNHPNSYPRSENQQPSLNDDEESRIENFALYNRF
nr:MAG TPA: hypothetical protein [Caudoviricetes sp.]